MISAHIRDPLKMLTHFLRAMYRCRSLPCPSGEAGSVRPRRRECAVEAHGPPAESEDMRGNHLRAFIKVKADQICLLPVTSLVYTHIWSAFLNWF